MIKEQVWTQTQGSQSVSVGWMGFDLVFKMLLLLFLWGGGSYNMSQSTQQISSCDCVAVINIVALVLH